MDAHMLTVKGKLCSVSSKNTKKLTSIRIVSKIPLSNIHMEVLCLKFRLQMAPSFAVEHFRVGQVQGFSRQNSMSSEGKERLAMTLCFDADNFEHFRLQTDGQYWL